ncbi:hypothetical protein BG000_006154 [Podila horticola]|nr:hypothetical protein BG000_006154 [Podila horticola]
MDEYPSSYFFTLDFNIGPAFRFVRHCEIRSLTGRALVTANEHPYEFTATVEKKDVQIKQGCGEVVFVLSSLEPWVSHPAKIVAPESSVGDSILENLYRDKASYDVFFEFKISYDDDTTSDPGDSDDSATTLRPRNRTEMRSSRLGAHKLVLSQWSHFKTKFESQSADDNKIKVENVPPKTFRLLLRFMYTGQLRDDKKPKVTYSEDILQGIEVVTWEGLFKAANEYNLDELCKLARDNILADLSPEKTIPFLFRTAYLYEMLYDPVIDHVQIIHDFNNWIVYPI